MLFILVFVDSNQTLRICGDTRIEYRQLIRILRCWMSAKQLNRSQHSRVWTEAAPANSSLFDHWLWNDTKFITILCNPHQNIAYVGNFSLARIFHSRSNSLCFGYSLICILAVTVCFYCHCKSICRSGATFVRRLLFTKIRLENWYFYTPPFKPLYDGI